MTNTDRSVPPAAPPTRRRLLIGAAALLAFGLLPPLSRETLAQAKTGVRSLKLYNPNTRERFAEVYAEGAEVLPRAQEALNHFMRDHRDNESVNIDPGVFELLWRLQERYRQIGLGGVTIYVNSGYRTKKTNDLLRSEGAAHASQHLIGKAVDITIEGYGIHFLGPQAERIATGGLGIYWRDEFVHFDTGPKRFWYQAM